MHRNDVGRFAIHPLGERNKTHNLLQRDKVTKMVENRHFLWYAIPVSVKGAFYGYIPLFCHSESFACGSSLIKKFSSSHCPIKQLIGIMAKWLE